MPDVRRYSDDEVRAILERALKHEPIEGTPHEDLVQAAAEVGVSRAALEKAASELAVSREADDARAEILRRRRAGLAAHLYAFLGVNAFLFGINWLTTPGLWWCLFPIFAWGLGLFFHARAALSKEVSPRTLEREKVRKERRERRLDRKLSSERRAAERRVRKERIEKGAAELGAAVEEGVGVLLSKVAEEIRKKADGNDRDHVRVDVPPVGVRVSKDAAGPRAAAGVSDASVDERARREAIADAEAEIEDHLRRRDVR
jgi:hypothetical protein